MLSQKEYQTRHSKDSQGCHPPSPSFPEPLPFERSDKVLGITGTTHLGFEKAHQQLSATKQMMQPMEEKQKSQKLAKSQGLKSNEESTRVELHKFLGVFAQQKQNEQRMKTRIQYDHIQDLHQMKNTDAEGKKSNYQQNYSNSSHPPSQNSPNTCRTNATTRTSTTTRSGTISSSTRKPTSSARKP